jgi:hypothetical protein
MHTIVKDGTVLPKFDVAEGMIARHLELWIDDWPKADTTEVIIAGLASLPIYLAHQVTDEFVRWVSCGHVRWDSDRCIGLVNQAVTA